MTGMVFNMLVKSLSCRRLHALEGQESSIVCALLCGRKVQVLTMASRIPVGFCFVLGSESNVKGESGPDF